MIHPREIERPAAEPRPWVDEIGDGLRFAALRAEWNALLDEAGADPFLAWDWLYPWWRRVAPDAAPRLLAARDRDGRLAGLLPLGERTLRAAMVPVRRWGFLGDTCVGSDYLDVLARRGDAERLVELMVDHLEQRLHRMDVLELLDLPRGSLLADRVLQRLGPRALVAERFPRFVCPLVPIRGGFEDYLRAVGRADNLARRRRWLQAQPGFAIEKVEGGAAVGDALADFFHLHRLRWERDGGSQGIAGAAVRSFHRDAAALLAESGRLRLYTLRVAGRALASVYAILHGERFYYYQSGYDPAWARRSVGLVLLGETLADAFGEGRKAFEFLRGSEPYKFEWARERRETEGVRLVFATPGGLAYRATQDGRRLLKGAARAAIGARGWQRLQRLRRRMGPG